MLTVIVIDTAHCEQAYDKRLMEVEAQRTELEAQRLDLQRKLRKLQSANAEEQARLKQQYQVGLIQHAASPACLRMRDSGSLAATLAVPGCA